MGPSYNKTTKEFDPRKDVKKGHMIIIRLSDDKPIWLRKELGDVYKDIANMERE